MRSVLIAITVSAMVMLGAGAGLAQSGTTDVKLTDGNVSVEADRLDIDENAGRAVFRGRVRVVEGNFNLTTKEMIAEYGPGGPQDLNILRANGNVVINIGPSLATGNRAIYDAHSEVLVVSGNATYKTGESILKGTELTVDFIKGTSNMVGGGKASGKRVTGIFSPKSN